MKITGIGISGYKIKDGKLVKAPQHLSASEVIRRKKSKRVRVVKPAGGH